LSAPGDLLVGRVLLIVEDEYLAATELARALKHHGATVVGPAPDVARALRLLERVERLDGAILDIQLRDERVFPVAEALRARAIPFIFVTGFDPETLPETYRGVPLCTKPIELGAAAAALFGGG
jgi:CheY-like chemotaxis protein